MLDIKCIALGRLVNNCYLITDKVTNKSALIDCTEYSDKMKRLIDGTNLEYILLTHGHFDHIGGASAVKEQTGAKLAISSEDEPMLTSSKLSLAAFVGEEHNDVSADIILNDGDEIKLGETVIKVIKTPGHTKGGVCYITDEAIFTGDTLFFCSCGRTDFPGGSSSEIIESLNRIARLDGNLTVYPGHDRRSTLDFERANNPYIKR